MATFALTACLTVGFIFTGIGLHNLQEFLERRSAEQHAKD